jgi:hypothetical protein
MLTVIDELTRECLAIEVKRRLNSQDVLAVLGRLFISRGVPDHIRLDNVGRPESAIRLLHRSCLRIRGRGAWSRGCRSDYDDRNTDCGVRRGGREPITRVTSPRALS